MSWASGIKVSTLTSQYGTAMNNTKRIGLITQGGRREENELH